MFSLSLSQETSTFSKVLFWGSWRPQLKTTKKMHPIKLQVKGHNTGCNVLSDFELSSIPKVLNEKIYLAKILAEMLE